MIISWQMQNVHNFLPKVKTACVYCNSVIAETESYYATKNIWHKTTASSSHCKCFPASFMKQLAAVLNWKNTTLQVILTKLLLLLLLHDTNMTSVFNELAMETEVPEWHTGVSSGTVKRNAHEEILHHTDKKHLLNVMLNNLKQKLVLTHNLYTSYYCSLHLNNP